MMQSSVATRHDQRASTRKRLLTVFAYVVVAGGAIVMLVPFAYMVITSIKSMTDAMKAPVFWIPAEPLWSNYVDVWTAVPLARIFVNTLKVSLLSVIGALLSCSLAGFAFARLRFRGRDVLFAILLATLMVPSQVTLIPYFLLFRELGLVNTHEALYLPAWFGSAFGIFMMRQFYLTIPRELEEAAKVDGCTPFSVFWRIFLPLGGPVTATLAIFTFLGSWNNLLGPLIFIQNRDLMVFSVALTQFGGQWFVNLPHLMTASIISIVPTMLVFLVLQKYFVQGVVISGLKA